MLESLLPGGQALTPQWTPADQLLGAVGVDDPAFEPLPRQPFRGPGVFQHFRLVALVSSARDMGSGGTEAALLTAHLRFWTRALGELLPGREVTVRWTAFGSPPLAERMRDTVLPALEPLPRGVPAREDPGRERARG